MRSKFLLFACCAALLALAGCATTQETGITRGEAIRIAKQACPEYPQQFEFVDRAEWIPEKGFWIVVIADQSGYNGRVFNINRNSEIVSNQTFHGTPPPVYYAPAPAYYGYPGPPVVVGVYGGGYYHRHW